MSPSRITLPSRRGRPRTEAVDAEDRALVLGVALEILEKEGASALSMRRIASEVNASYQVVYTLFGGRHGLLDALLRRGFEMLAARCREVPRRGSAARRFVDQALAYREFAIRHRQLYALMFGTGVQGFEPDRESRRIALSSFDVVLEAARDALDESEVARHRFPDAASLAQAAWSTTHGHVSLELDTWFGRDEGSAERLTQSMAALVGAEVDERPTDA
ncbi:MAG: WHG domain-containing protein [Myxococcota bacterium]|nr:WHG domain-containing protein [Myxococcota bacterium]